MTCCSGQAMASSHTTSWAASVTILAMFLVCGSEASRQLVSNTVSVLVHTFARDILTCSTEDDRGPTTLLTHQSPKGSQNLGLTHNFRMQSWTSSHVTSFPCSRKIGAPYRSERTCQQLDLKICEQHIIQNIKIKPWTSFRSSNPTRHLHPTVCVKCTPDSCFNPTCV